MSKAASKAIASIFDGYVLALRKTPVEQKTEHTDRGAMESLLQALAALQNSTTNVQHEPKRNAQGAPDFKVQNNASIIGYVENKKIGDNLDKVLKSDQIAKYQTLSRNIILNDYLQWIWLRDGKIVAREILCYESDLENRKAILKADRVEAVANLIFGFLSVAPEGVGRASELALALATRAHLLRDYLAEELVRQQRDKSQDRLFGLYDAFKVQVFQDLTLAEFADAFAQTLAYGLFLAALNSEKDTVTLRNAPDYIPGSFQLIRELVEFLPLLKNAAYTEIKWVVEEILAIVNTMDVAAIHEDLSFRNRKALTRKVQARDEEEWRLFSKDPFIYFYEDFLGKYDAKLRKSRGVYYTPPPIVNFIVRAIDDILKDTFGIVDGLADHKRVTVLDFACGTGTFLVEVLEKIFETIGPDSGKRDLIIKEHILKNIFGFEYLIAPYTIAHLKLSQYLNERQYRLAEGERIQVYLTNTLEPIAPQKNFTLPELTRETEAAQSIKDKPILVITGNPPYSGHSKNNGPHARTSIDGYKFTMEKTVDGLTERKPLGERNPKWLNDDYVKFIRFAQLKMDAVDEGIVGIITNHSWLDNPTFRGMRQSLMRSFDQIYVIDLHGNAKKKEKAPDGSKDENVFDIEQGVAISIFVKKRHIESKVLTSNLWGLRHIKYSEIASANIRRKEFTANYPESPDYLFIPQDRDLLGMYNAGLTIKDIFQQRVLGFQTHRDSFAIDFEEKDVTRKIMYFRDHNERDIKLKYNLKENRDWNVYKAKKLLDLACRKPTLCCYRPFDARWCLFGYEFMDYPRRELLDNVFERENIQLIVSRQVSTPVWRHSFVAEYVAESCLISNYTAEGNYNYFLYRYKEKELTNSKNVDLFYTNTTEKVENFTPLFRSFIDKKYAYHFTPEEIFGYIYAVLHAPTYRSVFAEFLRLDFPRIPFVELRDDFERLATLGWDLAQKHLLRDVPQKGLGGFWGKGDYSVEKPTYAEADQSILINKTQYFKPVPKAVWEFHIGGYQVIDKYLKSRKGRTLSLDEIENVTNICNVLQFTIDAMAEIDAIYRRAFPDHRLSEEKHV